MSFTIPKLPVADWVTSLVDWMTNNLSGFFNIIKVIANAMMNGVTDTLLFVNPLLTIVLVGLAAFFIGRKKWGLPTFTVLGLLFIYNQGLWTDLMNTVTLVIFSTLFSVILGVPLGILMAKNKRAASIINPILDFMQTMPSFVYLIPAVSFFSIGIVPGVFASVIFALPPTVRMTNLGITQIPTELVEASDSFGSTPRQKLFQLELPIAKPTIFAGINQTLMLALSMVVTASMIGAPGLGLGVMSALQLTDVGSGFVYGVSLVILAIIMDRFTQRLNQPVTARQPKTAQEKKRTRYIWLGAILSFLALFGARLVISSMQEQNEKVTLGYVNWESEVASTNVMAEVLKEQGFDVDLQELNNTALWQSVANGAVDASLSAWLPTTHGDLYDKYKDQLEDLGPNLTGVKTGLVVPAYMDVTTIEDLSDQAGKQITGIEPGAGVMTAAEKTINAYSNLSDWQLVPSSTGPMIKTLETAISNQEDVVITGWSPHWMFSSYDLKYLEDPKGTMGESEAIHTLTRKGFGDDHAKAQKILDNFNWTQSDMESVMLDIHNGMSPSEAAQKWISNNQETVNSWIQ